MFVDPGRVELRQCFTELMSWQDQQLNAEIMAHSTSQLQAAFLQELLVHTADEVRIALMPLDCAADAHV